MNKRKSETHEKAWEIYKKVKDYRVGCENCYMGCYAGGCESRTQKGRK